MVLLLADKIDLSISTSIRGHHASRRMQSNPIFYPPSLHSLTSAHKQLSIHSRRCAASSLTTLMFSIPPLFLVLANPHCPASLPQTPQRTALLTLFSYPVPRISMHRHILVLESTFRRLFASISRTIMGTAGDGLACDPQSRPCYISFVIWKTHSKLPTYPWHHFTLHTCGMFHCLFFLFFHCFFRWCII